MQIRPRIFVQQTDSVFAHYLATLGFMPDGKKHNDAWYACRRYRNDERYIEITAHCHFRDGEPECRVILGYGSNDWPECDWNTIALWRLSGSGSNYPIRSIDNIPLILDSMLADLQQHAQDFLSGNLERFFAELTIQNRQRDPTKIYSPQSDGTYKMTIDPVTQELKDRYSNPKNGITKQ